MHIFVSEHLILFSINDYYVYIIGMYLKTLQSPSRVSE